jgi:hypothetical protein
MDKAQLETRTRGDTEEERLVAELELLGIRYLSRHTSDRAECVRSPEALLADLVRQPSARVRLSVIAVLLAHPEYAQAVPAALKRLPPAAQWTLRFFYSAAVLLQQEYAERLRPFVAARRLPDRFGADLNLPVTASPRERLIALGRRHRQRTQTAVNWAGTYESAVRHLLRSWELEVQRTGWVQPCDNMNVARPEAALFTGE